MEDGRLKKRHETEQKQQEDGRLKKQHETEQINMKMDVSKIDTKRNKTT